MYVLNGRWHLIVAPLASEEREVRVEDPTLYGNSSSVIWGRRTRASPPRRSDIV
ncbi:hypothetical protein ACF08M_00035 [Streptomyces sp. NPDC015032]|uniref:hypothetical protein n=1 Tax=Streptomyces sp. NPDC015032 TaxID=3364937 RepID=UPI0036FB0221